MKPNSKERRPDILDAAQKILEFLKVVLIEAGEEIFIGFRRHTIPLQNCLITGLCISLLYHFEFDHWLLNRLHLTIFLLSGMPRFFMGTYLIFLPIHLWGLSKTARKMALKRKMKRMFEATGLETRLKETPKLIGDYPIDDWTRKLKLFSEGIPVKRYLERKDEIESILNASIIKTSNPPSRKDLVEIVYSKVDMPTLFKMDSIQAYKEFSFPVGMTWGREIITSLMDIPHFLVAGESGGGKSTFISMMTAVLLATNENLKVIFVDMKGGMQARIFDGIPQLEIASDPSDVATKLKVVLKNLDNRMETLRQANARDIDAYNRKFAGQRPSLNRILFIVDEFSELVPKFSSGDRKVLTEVNQGILRLARMGRACGIHLVVGIQKPDANNLDPGIKANLPGIVCFPVTHFSQSMLILGDGRAADLPSEVKGRAIWKYGIDQIEVQTPYVSENEIEVLAKSLIGKEAKQHEEKEDSKTAESTGSENSDVSVAVQSGKLTHPKDLSRT